MASHVRGQAQAEQAKRRTEGWKSMEPHEYENVMGDRILLQNAAVGREQAMAKLAGKYFRLLDHVEHEDERKVQDAHRHMEEEMKSFRSQAKQLKMVLDASRHERQLLVEKEKHLRKESQDTRQGIANLVQEISVVQQQKKELDEYEGLYKACAELPQVATSMEETQNLQRDTLRLEEEEQYLQASLDFYKLRFAEMIQNVEKMESQIGDHMSQR
eukprot:CAMPEP_0183829594 /NCGR_PEP_ID=MMETSP0807_2-20130328/3449_1 /TAXON_ID=88271 /ORGANISM="Picocystis salinarum, Strain CCMP1897" /LENGTH=214 /DNA_ID=CAMNT_0026074841 /DNA_START=20 /DNA_END=664 /DNA_ORIENTATION=+